jgi:hypothetical protein
MSFPLSPTLRQSTSKAEIKGENMHQNDLSTQQRKLPPAMHLPALTLLPASTATAVATTTQFFNFTTYVDIGNDQPHSNGLLLLTTFEKAHSHALWTGYDGFLYGGVDEAVFVIIAAKKGLAQIP